ncbi:MAG: hypothetical protein HY619_00625 [Thaumarchaeota archaeon]|nr:hypothetical protein [Nitrososphaerota archaeon]
MTVAIDIIQAEGRVTLPSILPTLSKMAEHRPICVFLIAVPSIDRKAQETAEAHGIVCIHGTVQDICEKGAEKLRQGVGEVLSRINSGNEER